MLSVFIINSYFLLIILKPISRLKEIEQEIQSEVSRNVYGLAYLVDNSKILYHYHSFIGKLLLSVF